MAAEFARQLQNAIVKGEIECDLRGYAMGNAWISPIDSTLTWAPFILSMSNADEAGHERIQEVGRECKRAVDEGRWTEATDLWRATQMATLAECNRCNFYNILEYQSSRQADAKGKSEPEVEWFDWLLTDPIKERRNALNDLMNGPVREYLGVIPPNVTWGGQRGMVFLKQAGDFMKPVIHVVDQLLNTTNLHAVVYQGQLDIICDTLGALDWVQKLRWTGLREYNQAEKFPLTDPISGQTDTFLKAHEDFKFYWLIKSGHAAPRDSEAALRMMVRIVNDIDR